jgi:PAS domain S-box-containing protein
MPRAECYSHARVEKKKRKPAGGSAHEGRAVRRRGGEGGAARGRSARGQRASRSLLPGPLLGSLVASAADGVIAADREGRILVFNEAAAEILGYTPEEALETLNLRDVYAPGAAAEVMESLQSEDFGGRGKLKSYPVHLRRKDGGTVPARLDASLVYDQGRETAVVGFFHDLREEQRIKEELARTQMQLVQAEKMASLGKLAAGVAHQLNNPLNGITLFASLTMEEHELPDEVRKNLFRIRKDAERCRDTVRELLEFARQTGRNIRPHDINQSVERTLFLLEDQSLFQNIQIDRRLSPSLPRIPVDVQQMNHVFMNIILNAADAMNGAGRLTVRSYCSEDGERVCVEIADTGSGIPPEVLPHIFEPFFTTKEAGKGTGLGLSVAYGIVLEHHGSIRVTGRPGEGAVFTVELPVSAQNAGDAPREKGAVDDGPG